MSTDDTTDDDEDSGHPETEAGEGEGGNVRERLGEGADRAVTGFDEGIVDLLSWVLETETRARIYVSLRQHPESTSDEIAENTGLYPSTVREALAELHDEGKVTRRKRESDGAGNNPYEYSAMPPSELVGNIVDDVQAELNTVFNLDEVLGDGEGEADGDVDSEPVTITVDGDGSGDGTSTGSVVDADSGAGDGALADGADAVGDGADDDGDDDGADGDTNAAGESASALTADGDGGRSDDADGGDGSDDTDD